MLKGDWTERSAHNAAKSWLSLGSSRDLKIQAVICQNDAMAMGARKAFVDLTEKGSRAMVEYSLHRLRRRHQGRVRTGCAAGC